MSTLHNRAGSDDTMSEIATAGEVVSRDDDDGHKVDADGSRSVALSAPGPDIVFKASASPFVSSRSSSDPHPASATSAVDHHPASLNPVSSGSSSARSTSSPNTLPSSRRDRHRPHDSTEKTKTSVAPPNVVVVGGGIVGASIAWHLSHSANVTIVAEKLGGVATPNSFAWLNAGATAPEFYYNFRHHSMGRWHEILSELPGLPINFSGALTFNMDEAGLETYLQEKGVELGYGIVRVGQMQIAEMEPSLEESHLPDWAVLANEEGFMEAHLVALQLIADAESRGATLLEGTRVTGFIKNADGSVRGVATSTTGDVSADHVVLAAGLGSVALLAAEDIRLPLSGRDGLLINTKPVSTTILNTVYNGAELHMRQTFEGRIQSGSDYGGGPVGDNPAETALALFATLQGLLRDEIGETLEYDYYTVGTRPDPEDGYPILGRTGLDGLTVAVMHSGVTNGAAVGELLTKQILTGVTDPLLEPFRLDRFAVNSTTAGMERMEEAGGCDSE